MRSILDLEFNLNEGARVPKPRDNQTNNSGLLIMIPVEIVRCSPPFLFREIQSPRYFRRIVFLHSLLFPVHAKFAQMKRRALILLVNDLLNVAKIDMSRNSVDIVEGMF